MRVDELRELGLYDPASPDAEGRLALLELVLAHGATVDDIREAIAAGHLHVLAAECVMRGESERLTLAEVASRAELTEDDALAVWRSWGFPDPASGARRFTDADADALRTLRGLAGVTGREPAIAFARTIGESSSKIAEAVVSLLRSRIEASLFERGGTSTELAHTFTYLAKEFLPRLARAVDTVLRHHLEVVGRRYSAAGEPANSANSVRLVVGFADVVGYTALSSSLPPGDLSNLMSRFEAESAERIARRGANLVKRIGDAVMFVTPSVEAAVAVAFDLIAVGSDRLELRDGDFYGPAVNLASRLTDAAAPGSVLVPADLALALAGTAGIADEPLGLRELSGIAAPVGVHALHRSVPRVK
jgi:adenylate cyclase